MTQLRTIGRVATTIERAGLETRVVYHSTPVVRFTPDKIILNSGGWHTPTTKVRMNQVSNQYNLGYQVYQEKFVWYVTWQGRTIPFRDGMVLYRREPQVLFDDLPEPQQIEIKGAKAEGYKIFYHLRGLVSSWKDAPDYDDQWNLDHQGWALVVEY